MTDLDADFGGPDGDADEPKKKRKKSTSPTQRTLSELKRRGWTAQVVERNIPFPRPRGTKIDLFGVIDIVALGFVDGKPKIFGIQATSDNGGTHAARRAKILAEPRAAEWVRWGAELELWSWGQRGARGAKRKWSARVENYRDMVAAK